jgi:hypothetical protein
MDNFNYPYRYLIDMTNLTLFCFSFLQFLAVFAFKDDIGFHKTDMSIEMEQYVIAQSLLISGNESDFNNVAKKISNGMNKKFGKN